jgi:predicted Ser/Thr protein kinase
VQAEHPNKQAQERTDGDLLPLPAIDGFVLMGEIGRGGSAVIYRAKDRAGRQFALKVSHAGVHEDAAQCARLQREASVLTGLRHRNIVRVQSAGALPDGRAWIAMELLSGDSLRTRVGQPRSLAQAWALLRPIIDAVALLHDNGITHRDIKPENIVLNHAGEPVLIDFALARAPHAVSSPITADDTSVGTPAYMAPEQWWNHNVGPACDQYAIGCVLYELTTGSTPFVERSWAAWTEAHLHTEAPRLANTTEEQSAFVSKLLAKTAADRFASVRELLREGDRLFAPSAHPWPTARWRTSGMSMLVIAAGVGAFALLGHGDVHSPLLLCRLAGWGVWLVLALTVYAMVSAGLARQHAAVAIAVALAGAVGALTGWRIVLQFVSRLALEERFSVLHEGLLEADINRAFALCVSSGITLAVALGAKGTRARFAWGPIGALLLLCVGNRTDSLVLVGAMVLWMIPFAVAVRDERSELWQLREKSALALLALLTFSGFLLVHLGAYEALVWRHAQAHAQRVEALATVSRDRIVVIGVMLCGCVAIAALYRLSALRCARVPSTQTVGALWRSHGATVLLALACIAANALLEGKIASARADIRRAYAGQFAIFQSLDPLRATGEALRSALRAPHVTASVQIAQDAVAIDRQRVLRVRALQTPSARQVLVQDLTHRLAQERTVESVTVSVLADRETPWAVLRTVLESAINAGAADFELLYARGERPRWNVWAPQESVLMLPSDFAALRVRCAAGARGSGAPTIQDNTSLAQLSAGLIAQAAGTQERVALVPCAP